MRASVSKLFMAASALVLAASAAQAQESKVLNVYNWSDYIAPDTIERFTQETGIRVNYDVYDSNEILDAKLIAGNSGYDVVFPSASPFLARQIESGVYQKLDKAKLGNIGNLQEQVMKSLEKSDPGNQFAVPYMIAPTGFAFNVAKIRELVPDAPTDSWAMLFDPKVAEKLKGCGMTLLDDPTEVFPAALAYLGKDPTSLERDDLDAAADAVMKIRPMLKYIHSSSYINGLANGDICIAHGYGGDLIQARDRAAESGQGVEIQVVVPKEGAQVVVDVMAVPKDAPNPENALTFINFMMRPDVVGPITNEVGYANAVKGSEEFVSEERKADPVIYPPQEVADKFFVAPAAPQSYDRLRTRAWTRIKTRY
ncbi:polyamine ABC transporter substrate-binding protein [Telmatospirillum sp. J64-1]|uniref:polyamine ABC transporter substrate-binding protein n=1 Tax=Telmatospirillum sp. J64-1 TaxID=2502183 RepID=UPI00115EEFF4|nr:polyamine ABC transporter substrate-binding protein [Telmatospirillum sp. J64-1]